MLNLLHGEIYHNLVPLVFGSNTKVINSPDEDTTILFAKKISPDRPPFPCVSLWRDSIELDSNRSNIPLEQLGTVKYEEPSQKYREIFLTPVIVKYRLTYFAQRLLMITDTLRKVYHNRIGEISFTVPVLDKEVRQGFYFDTSFNEENTLQGFREKGRYYYLNCNLTIESWVLYAPSDLINRIEEIVINEYSLDEQELLETLDIT